MGKGGEAFIPDEKNSTRKGEFVTGDEPSERPGVPGPGALVTHPTLPQLVILGWDCWKFPSPV